MAAVGLATAWNGAEAAPATKLDIRGGALSSALVELSRQTKIDLLFDQRLVQGISAPRVRGLLTPEAALSQLLAGTGIGYRVATGGAYVLYVAAKAPVVEQGDGAVAELLVLGRRTQNVDIRRTLNDIQPYAVLGRADIEASGRMTIGEVLRAREPADNSAGGFSGLNSSIDLRGFGDTSTLVLVDGRRMPFLPTVFGEVGQADVNGIPLGAVERIEVLTTTAGGIYGPGAVGGVVNIVLRRAYRGADLNLYAGSTDRADAQHARFEGRLGFTPDNGSTDVMLFVAHARGSALRAGQRDYMERAGRMRFANDPTAYTFNPPVRKGVSVVSLAGNLTLDPAYGGAVLGSAYTFLPLNFEGSPGEAGALLAANAGKLPLQLSDDASGGRQYITVAPTVTSGLLNLRREIGPDIEVFLDGIYAQSRGRYVDERGPFIAAQGAARPGNPFGQDVRLTFPVAFRRTETTQELELNRWTGGLIASLPAEWKASVDYTMADLSYRLDGAATDTGNALAIAVSTGQPSPEGASPVFPFGSWDAVAAALPAYALATSEHINLKQESRALSLRLAGPLFALPGGRMTATLLAEGREDRTGGSSVVRASEVIPAPARLQKVRSLYAEVRAPLGAADSDHLLLRGLEAQLALRHDRMTQIGPSSVVTRENPEQFSVGNNANTFTLGARLLPSPSLLLRGSLATGERPPTLSDLQTLDGEALATDGPPDPRRAGRPLGSEGSWLSRAGGSTRVGPAQARSFTIGAVFNPSGDGRPRLSVDYSRTVLTREAVPFPLTATELLSSEAAFPDRVVRAPLSPSDVTDGLSVGRVVALDTSAVNAGRTIVETVDARLDWRLPPTSFGDVRLYGAATWQPTFKRRVSGDQAAINRSGYMDGPLEWRGNAGVEWAKGLTIIDLNAQFYDSYRVSHVNFSASANAQEIRYQGSDHVPAQVYVDVSVRRKFTAVGGSADMEARLSIQNVFDHSPPIVAPSSSLGFSEYGDPRRRRITLTIAAEF